ncbi:hypothetical protein BV455_04061 (plasmid) [Parageobacillus caldoxylosilyticus]|uniref:hypothetical protein n=1 Tax=Saccharococcus caldoxylosilyticus TaxID=81408 RepID=UPI001C4DF92F|nr:hypothetical protein [Parageobacillus caldoxylosilyticus]QXJ40684.1 hypothetical protein BV455_04061 [Parageobacillus caldoxylosilyticus]
MKEVVVLTFILLAAAISLFWMSQFIPKTLQSFNKVIYGSIIAILVIYFIVEIIRFNF